MKRALSVFLAIILLFSSISTVVAASELNIFISMPEYADAMRELIAEYKKVRPDVTINYETTQTDYPTLLKVKLNSGDVPDIFASTTGKEIEVYKEYSYDLSDQPLSEALDPSVKESMVDADGNGLYGIAIKGNYFGMVHNKDLFDQAGVEVPKTLDELEEAIVKLEAAGITPFTSGFGEWWVFKHAFQHFMASATDDVAGLVEKFERGEAKLADYPELYENWFRFVDLVYAHSDDKPLEATINNAIVNIALGRAAMAVGQGPWIEAGIVEIDPDVNIGLAGYPISDDPAQAQVISGADLALRISNRSKNLDDVLDFVNWWHTSEYGKDWFIDVAKVVSPVINDRMADFELVQDGAKQIEENGAAPISIIHSTDSFHMTFGEIMQAYVSGQIDRDEACARIEQKWVEIDG
ncbi:MAG TPA: extracellular solute-binding protein [Natronincola sp.]|nr:extracellular solute-binding protein [Natronincola sp.]